MLRAVWDFAAFAGLLIVGGAIGLAQEPLHQRIDRAIATATPDYAAKAAAPADDAEFLRRVSLDLTGTIPSADQARDFFTTRRPRSGQR